MADSFFLQKTYCKDLKRIIMKRLIIVILSVFTFTVVQGQEKSSSIVEATFKVDGVCEMCKKRIESSALRTKGVKLAEWDKSTKELKVVYNSNKTSEESIHQAVAAQGHNTPTVEADTNSYAKLPGCCQYKHGAKCAK